MEGRCERHLFDEAIDLCGRCGGEFCPDCVVYSFGASRAPLCLPCAVAAAGVRHGRTSGLARRERKALLHRREAFLAARAARGARQEAFEG